MDWTLVEDNMVNGLFFCATLTSCSRAITHLCKQEWKRLTLVQRELCRTHAVLCKAIPGGWVPMSGMGSAESRSVLQPLRIPSVIRPERRAFVVDASQTDKSLCGAY